MAKALEKSNIGCKLACPNCRSAFATPKMLQCSHFFCPECIKGMSISVSADSSHKYECIICSSITTSDKLRELQFVSDILNVVGQEQGDTTACASCNKHGSLQRCLDCKDNFCDTCRIEHHDKIPLLKKHSWEGKTDTKRSAIDRIEYCIVHPMKALALYCCECALLVCDDCIVAEHENHCISSGEEQILQTTTKYEFSLKVIATEHADALERVVSLAENLKKSYEDMELQIERVTEDVIKKIREEAVAAKTNLTKIRETHLTEVSHTELSLERKLQSQENVLHLTQEIKSAAEKMSRLHFLETIKPCFETHLNDKLNVDYSRDFSARAELFISEHPIALGISPLTNKKCLHFSGPLTDVATKKFELEKEIKLDYVCTRFLPILERAEIWCVKLRSDTIHVFSFEGKKLNVVMIDNHGTIRSLAWNGKHVLVATSSGLFQADITGTVLSQIASYEIADVSIWEDFLYVLDDTNARVLILTPGFYEYCYSSEIVLNNHRQHELNTIQATSEYVFVADCYSHCIQAYKTDGSFVRKYNNDIYELPWISCPMLSGADDHDNVLVVCNLIDCASLYVLSSDGEQRHIKIDGLYYPWCAFLHQNHFYIVEGGYIGNEAIVKIFNVV